MKRFGFTLSEMLITLGIIGVIAALTMPVLVKNNMNTTNAAKLSVTVSNLENAFQNAMVQEGVTDIRQTQMWGDLVMQNGNIDEQSGNKQKALTFIGRLGKYINLNGYKNLTDIYPNGLYAMSINGDKGTLLDVDDVTDEFYKGLPVLMKNGAVIIITTYKDSDASGSTPKTITEDEAVSRGTALRADSGTIYVDVNGSDSPNTIGRDIFAFTIGQNGVLYPYGGHDMAALFNSTTWKDSGLMSCIPKSNQADGIGCTARLIEENYKMNY